MVHMKVHVSIRDRDHFVQVHVSIRDRDHFVQQMNQIRSHLFSASRDYDKELGSRESELISDGCSGAWLQRPTSR